MFYSILFSANEEKTFSKKTDCLKDLNLNQIFNPIIQKEKDYNLGQYFYTPVTDTELIKYRQATLRDMDNKEILSTYDEFSKEIYLLNSDIKSFSEKYKHDNSNVNTISYISKGYILNYSERYCDAIKKLTEKTEKLNIKSKGLKNFNEYINTYISSDKYAELRKETEKIRKMFSNLEYCLFIKNGTIKVKKYNNEEDFSDEALNIFEKFIEPDSKNYLRSFPERSHSEHMENKILTLLEKVYPKEFSALDKFSKRFINFVDETIFRFSREIRFFISWQNYINNMKTYNLPFCYPEISENRDDLYAYSFFDLALANKIKNKVIVNDFYIKKPEHILVITGPNQGGKTTFARSFGQLYYITALGLSVPGTNVKITVADNIFTHFEKEENFITQRGKLQDDVERLHKIIKNATKSSIIIANEIFASTTLNDAVKLGRLMINDFIELGAVCLVVTFMDELATYSKETVSMMSTVKENNSNERTFKIIRRPPDGIAHALFIAEKYGLTYSQIIRRFK